MNESNDGSDKPSFVAVLFEVLIRYFEAVNEYRYPGRVGIGIKSGRIGFGYVGGLLISSFLITEAIAGITHTEIGFPMQEQGFCKEGTFRVPLFAEILYPISQMWPALTGAILLHPLLRSRKRTGRFYQCILSLGYAAGLSDPISQIVMGVSVRLNVGFVGGTIFYIWTVLLLGMIASDILSYVYNRSFLSVFTRYLLQFPIMGILSIAVIAALSMFFGSEMLWNAEMRLLMLPVRLWCG